MKNLFIDTNTFLSFYHLTNEDLEELKKLVVLIDNSEVRLFLPRQVRNEFTRNRGAKIVDAMRKLQDTKFNLAFPSFAKDYNEYAELRELMKKANDVHASLVGKVLSDAKAEAFNADGVVAALFEKAQEIGISDDIFMSALERVRLGNPPGKEGSMGDAVNWVCLLKEVPHEEDINIVSGDKDFRSQLFDGDIHEYLDKEWSEKKNSSVWFYSKISDYFKDDFPNIKIASELENDLLIQNLLNSGSFASTHGYIAKLSKQQDFSPAQVEHLIEIPETNNQVGWIIDDDDVHSFYKSLLNGYGDKVQANAAIKLAQLVAKGEPVVDDKGP